MAIVKVPNSPSLFRSLKVRADSAVPAGFQGERDVDSAADDRTSSTFTPSTWAVPSATALNAGLRRARRSAIGWRPNSCSRLGRPKGGIGYACPAPPTNHIPSGATIVADATSCLGARWFAPAGRGRENSRSSLS